MSTNKLPSIAIIGAGWLGKPLARALRAQDYPLTVSCSHADKTANLVAQGIPAVSATLTSEPQGDWQSLLANKDIAVCLLPASRGNHADSPLAEQITQLLLMLKQYHVGKFIFVSSTSIYQKTNNTLTETSTLNPSSTVYAAEQLIQQQQDIDYTIIRFAGLISEDRNPTRSLSKKSADGHIFDAGASPVNLIHQSDAIGVIQAVIKQQCWGQIFNACCDQHASRQAFYQQGAKQLGITVPRFTSDNSKPDCIIANDKLKALLSYQFKHQSATDLVT
ncbi:NAD(P)H-binding protein [Moritella sp. Urea-trap-13]|uniref:NAD(P)H-binding protein n=1 Tax=Moritella sp. Urea-trap-13 TaxID=2058327 RepID=UPI000C340A9E|nr:NAD(P)H-binding protein [Moritella sp. Urea-trap-13]PKH05768.1 dTDP-glucose 4,6-dehydratase [Moritella sp. Urea-trap-13]